MKLAVAAAALLCSMQVQATDDSPAVNGGPLLPATASTGILQTFKLRLPAAGRVIFHGEANLDNAGLGTASFMYPAPNVGGLLVAIATHAFISESAKDNQKKQLQDKADEVLRPFEKTLAALTLQTLLAETGEASSAAPRYRPLEGEAAADDWLIETVPIFFMTQDRRALLLDNMLSIFARGQAKPVYTQRIQVISQPRAEADNELLQMWNQEEGRPLIDESRRLLLESLDVAVAEMATVAPADGQTSPRTIRFRKGGTEHFERASLVRQQCGRQVIRNLRGELMSVPASLPVSSQDACVASMSTAR